MTWEKEYIYIYIPQYEWTSINQHGNRFKRTGTKRLSVAKISCKTSDTGGAQKLILLSDTLDTPVRYNFNKQEAYIRIVSHEMLEECL